MQLLTIGTKGTSDTLAPAGGRGAKKKLKDLNLATLRLCVNQSGVHKNQ